MPPRFAANASPNCTGPRCRASRHSTTSGRRSAGRRTSRLRSGSNAACRRRRRRCSRCRRSRRCRARGTSCRTGSRRCTPGPEETRTRSGSAPDRREQDTPRRRVSRVGGISHRRRVSRGCAEKRTRSVGATQAAAAGLVKPAARALERAAVQRAIVVEAVVRAIEGSIGAHALGVVVARISRTEVVRLLGRGGSAARGKPAADRASR